MFDLTSFFLALFLSIILVGLLISGSILSFYVFRLWMRNKNRESESLGSTLLQIALPRDNEIKIDAAEQLFSSFAAIGKPPKRFQFKNPPHLSFEIVGLPGDIRFYVHVPKKLRDFVEKQINGAYPEAEITPIDDPTAKQKHDLTVGNDYNIFSQNGKVAFASLKLKGEGWKPMKVYKEFPIDPLSSITSIMAKMSEGEGMSIQMLQLQLWLFLASLKTNHHNTLPLQLPLPIPIDARVR